MPEYKANVTVARNRDSALCLSASVFLLRQGDSICTQHTERWDERVLPRDNTEHYEAHPERHAMRSDVTNSSLHNTC